MLKLLLSRSKKEKIKIKLFPNLLIFFNNLKRLFIIFWTTIFDFSKTTCRIEKYYRFLLLWGKISGLEHTNFEAPREYCLRIIDKFPSIKHEIKTIIQTHEKVIYGYITPTDLEIRHIKLALRKIRSPLLWYSRFKLFLIHD